MGLIKNKSLKLSAPIEKTLHGVKIRKLPIGQYIKVMRTIDELPQLLVEKVLPEKSVGDLFSAMKNIDKDSLVFLIGRLITVVPEELMKLIGDLLDIPLERLLGTDENALGLSELTEILLAFWEANDMTDFFANARRLAKTVTQSTGFSAGSPSGRV